MELMRTGSAQPALPTVQPELAATPGPPATPTPRPTLMPVTGELPAGAYLAAVTGIEDDSSLNLRAEPNTASEIIMRLYKHQQLVVLETCEDPAWVKVRTDVVEVGHGRMVSFLEKLDATPAPATAVPASAGDAEASTTPYGHRRPAGGHRHPRSRRCHGHARAGCRHCCGPDTHAHPAAPLPGICPRAPTWPRWWLGIQP